MTRYTRQPRAMTEMMRVSMVAVAQLRRSASADLLAEASVGHAQREERERQQDEREILIHDAASIARLAAGT